MATVPYTIATQPAGNLPGAYLDANWAACTGVTGSLTVGNLLVAAAGNNVADAGMSAGQIQGGGNTASYLPYTAQVA